MFKIQPAFFALSLFVFNLNLVFSEVNELSKVIVEGTAQNTQLENVPGSVSVINEDDITKSGAEFFQNQIIDVPNLNTAGGTSRPRFFQIRGIGELEQYEGAPNSSVAVIVDDVDLTGIGAALTLFDVSQLEVHRGPQAIRFGSSALAGALYLSTEDPTDFYSGKFQASAGNDELFQSGFGFGGPISDSFGFRLSGFVHDQDGFRDNDFFNVEDTNERQEYLGRLKLNFSPNENTDFTLSLLNTKLDNGYDAFSIFNGFNTQSDKPGEDAETLRLAALKGKIKLTNDTELTTITSYYESDLDYSFDGDWGNNPFWAPFDPYDFFSDTDRERQVFAQQLRLNTNFETEAGQIEWLNGFFFQTLDEDTLVSEFFNGEQFDFLDSSYKADTIAGFTNLVIPLSNSVDLALGGRVEHRDTAYNDSRGSMFSPNDLMLGGNISLNYENSENSNWYLLASRGFRGGGFNENPSLTEDRREYDPESLVNLELGNYSTFLNGDLRTAINAFVNFRRDQQVKLGLQVDPSDPLSFSFLTDNAARGRSYGLEAEVDYSATENLIFDMSGSLLKTEITEVDALLASLDGREQSHAPSWQYSFNTEYFLTNDLLFEIGVQGRASFFFDDSHDQRSSVYHLLNAALSYFYDDWEFRLWARNLTDEEYEVRGFFFGNEPPDFPNTEYVQLGDPRTFGATAILRF